MFLIQPIHFLNFLEKPQSQRSYQQASYIASNSPDLGRTLPVLYDVFFHTFAVLAKFDFQCIYCNLDRNIPILLKAKIGYSVLIKHKECR